jgi:hypothetical protein
MLAAKTQSQELMAGFLAARFWPFLFDFSG